MKVRLRETLQTICQTCEIWLDLTHPVSRYEKSVNLQRAQESRLYSSSSRVPEPTTLSKNQNIADIIWKLFTLTWQSIIFQWSMNLSGVPYIQILWISVRIREVMIVMRQAAFSLPINSIRVRLMNCWLCTISLEDWQLVKSYLIREWVRFMISFNHSSILTNHAIQLKLSSCT